MRYHPIQLSFKPRGPFVINTLDSVSGCLQSHVIDVVLTNRYLFVLTNESVYVSDDIMRPDSSLLPSKQLLIHSVLDMADCDSLLVGVFGGHSSLTQLRALTQQP